MECDLHRRIEAKIADETEARQQHERDQHMRLKAKIVDEAEASQRHECDLHRRLKAEACRDSRGDRGYTPACTRPNGED